MSKKNNHKKVNPTEVNQREGQVLIFTMVITTRKGKKIRRPDGKPWAIWVKEVKRG